MSNVNLANVRGSSEAAGTKSPLHVMVVGQDGNPVVASVTGFWSAAHAPAANTKATATKASAGTGIRNVCTGITVLLAGGAAAPTAGVITVALIDGAAGGTTYLWGPVTLAIAAVAGALNGIARSGLWVGSQATAMTLEFSAAAGANTVESVSLEGGTITA